MKKFVGNAVASAASVVKIALMSRRPKRSAPADKAKSIVILGNGPSLLKTMERSPRWLASQSRMAVNYAALSKEFWQLRPDYYAMMDPGLFPMPDPKDTSLSADVWREFRAVDWPMTLVIPSRFLSVARLHLDGVGSITVKTVNITPVEGWTWLAHFAYRQGLGMPRPRNVMIGAIMGAMQEGFGKIYLAGADHSWTRTLSIDEDNNVCNIVEHFYEEKKEAQETARIVEAYRGLHLHDVLQSLVVAFRSYFHIKEYADARGVEIVNITPGSFIDAFPHRLPPKEKADQSDDCTT